MDQWGKWTVSWMFMIRNLASGIVQPVEVYILYVLKKLFFLNKDYKSEGSGSRLILFPPKDKNRKILLRNFIVLY